MCFYRGIEKMNFVSGSFHTPCSIKIGLEDVEDLVNKK